MRNYNVKSQKETTREIVEDFTALCWLTSLLPNHVRSDLCIKLYTHKFGTTVWECLSDSVPEFPLASLKSMQKPMWALDFPSTLIIRYHIIVLSDVFRGIWRENDFQSS